ncbi:unknown [Bacteroides sp. CAG:462]|nr:unknown [Bacteroides sp. CAG:462]
MCVCKSLQPDFYTPFILMEKYILVDLLEVLLLLKVKNMDFLVEFLSKVFLKVKERK